jgi:hypothetical protein
VFQDLVMLEFGMLKKMEKQNLVEDVPEKIVEFVHYCLLL